MLTVYEARKLAGRAHLENANANTRNMLILAAIACTFIALAVLASSSESQARAKSLPGIVISTHCGSCPWDRAFERALATSYVQAAARRAHAIDFGSPVQAVIEHYDPRTTNIAVRIWFAEDTLYLTSDRTEPNAGAALRSLGVRVADAVAEAVAAGATPPWEVGFAASVAPRSR